MAENYSRREVLKNLGLTAGALATGGLLAACAGRNISTNHKISTNTKQDLLGNPIQTLNPSVQLFHVDDTAEYYVHELPSKILLAENEYFVAPTFAELNKSSFTENLTKAHVEFDPNDPRNLYAILPVDADEDGNIYLTTYDKDKKEVVDLANLPKSKVPNMEIPRGFGVRNIQISPLEIKSIVNLPVGNEKTPSVERFYVFKHDAPVYETSESDESKLQTESIGFMPVNSAFPVTNLEDNGQRSLGGYLFRAVSLESIPKPTAKPEKPKEPAKPEEQPLQIPEATEVRNWNKYKDLILTPKKK